MDLVAQIQALNRIGIALTSETNLQKLMELILEEARELTRADGGSLYLKEKEQLIFYVTQNKTLSDWRNFNGGFKYHALPISPESIAGFVAGTGEILSIGDAHAIPDSAPYRFNYDFDRENNYRTRSLLVVPLKTPDGDVVGVLQLINATDEAGRVTAFPEGLTPLAKSLASQAAVALRNARLIRDIKTLLKSIVQFSASAIDARSPHTAGHSKRVAAYSRAIAEAISRATSGPFANIVFSPEQLEELYFSAWLHDIGKIGIPEAVLDKRHKVSEEQLSAIRARFELAKFVGISRLLEENCGAGAGADSIGDQRREICRRIDDGLELVQRITRCNRLADEDLELLKELAGTTFRDPDGKPHPLLDGQEFAALAIRKGNLTEEEYRKVQSHVVQTQQIIENIPFPDYLANVPLYASSHHEMVDGSGYPRKLKGEQLPLQARILAVVDIYDALTAVDRPYRKSMETAQALEALVREADRGRLDSDVVRIFIDERLYEAARVHMKDGVV